MWRIGGDTLLSRVKWPEGLVAQLRKAWAFVKVLGEAKVSEYEMTSGVDKNIGSFNVTMDDPPAVDDVQGDELERTVWC